MKEPWLSEADERGPRQAAKSRGEGHMPNDPRISEWGNPMEATPSSCRQEANPGN